MKRKEGNGLNIPKMHELVHACRDILRHGLPMNDDTCLIESNHCPMKVLSQNIQRIKSRFEFQTASRFYEENIITISYKPNKNNISTVSKGIKTSSSEMTKGIKSSQKYFVKYEGDTKNKFLK